MKQHFRLVVLALVLLLLTGCSHLPEAEVLIPPSTAISPAEAGFDAVYADICRLLDSGSTEQAYTYVSTGMLEVVAPKATKEERCSSISYALEDLEQDGSPELIVLDAEDNARILAIFALENGQPVLTQDGWYRSRLYRLDDGTLYREGSGGAAYSVFDAYGQRWFTYPKGEDQQELGYYYAFDGSYDPTTAQEITADEYQEKQAELAGKITAFSARPFG